MALHAPPTGSVQMKASDLLTYEPGEPVAFLVDLAPHGFLAHLRVKHEQAPQDYFPVLPNLVNCVRLCDGTNQRIGYGYDVFVLPQVGDYLKILR